jgi:hypothetical protein
VGPTAPTRLFLASVYRSTHGTFEDYCRDRWEMSATHAYRQIEAAKVVAVLSPIGDIPATESQARELVPLKDDPEAMSKILGNDGGDGSTATAYAPPMTVFWWAYAVGGFLTFLLVCGLYAERNVGTFPYFGAAMAALFWPVVLVVLLVAALRD